MSNETPRPPKAAEHENTAEMMAPTANPPEVAPASVTPTGQAGARRKLGKTGPPGPAAKGRTVAKRKPEKKRPAPTGVKRAAARKKNTRAGEASSFREKSGWRTEPKVGGRKPSADQKRSAIKKAGPARKTLAKRAAAKTTAAAKRAPAAAKRTAAKRAPPAAAKRPAAKRAPAAAKRPAARRTTGRR